VRAEINDLIGPQYFSAITREIEQAKQRMEVTDGFR